MVLRRIRFVFPAPSVVQLHPVIFSVFNIASVFQSLCEEVPKVVIVGGVLESKIPYVSEILVKFLCVMVSILKSRTTEDSLTWIAVAEILDCSGLLLFTNLLILLLVGSSLQSLPRKTASKEVKEDMTKGLEIIPSRLFASKVSIDTHVTSSSRQRLPLTVWNVLLSLGIAVLLGHTEINDMDHVGRLTARTPDEEVVWFDVSVDQVLLMDSLDTGKLIE